MIHLTLTGYYVGRPLCDCNKEKATSNGDSFVHAMYWNEKQQGYERNKVCPKCLEAWDSDD